MVVEPNCEGCALKGRPRKEGRGNKVSPQVVFVGEIPYPQPTNLLSSFLGKAGTFFKSCLDEINLA